MSASIKEMFFFVHGPSICKKAVAVFYGFFDASNTHKGAKVWTLCGFLAEEDSFTALDSEWNRVLDKPEWPIRLKRFHTVECVHGEGEFVGWSFAERLAIFGDLASVVMTTPCAAISSIVINEDFDKLEANELELLKSEGLGTALDLSLQSVLQRSIRITRNTSDAEKIGLIFDNENTENSKRIIDFSSLYKDKFGFDQWFAGIGFGVNSEMTPLQAADLLAYGTYRFSMLKYPNIVSPDFPIIPAFMRMAEGIVGDSKGGFDIDSMKQLVSEVRRRHADDDNAQNETTQGI